jgi:hypothetical protein
MFSIWMPYLYGCFGKVHPNLLWLVTPSLLYDNYWKKLSCVRSFKYDANKTHQMVSWKEIEYAIHSNPDRNHVVERLESKTVGAVEQFPLPATASMPVHVPSASVPSASVPSAAAPVPVAAPVPSASVPSAAAPVPVAAPVPSASVAAPAIHTVPDTINTIVTPVKEPVTQKQEVDPISIGIEERDILYTGVSKRTKHQMECEEAQRLEGMLSELYKSQGGRSRGWTKSGLDLMIKPRCASGGNIKELDRAKQAFTWQLVGDNKELSAFLDFICVAKKIRIAVWFTEEKRILLYPAADYAGVEETDHFPLYHVDSKGHIRRGFDKGTELVTFCNSNNYVMLPPISVMNSLSKLSVDELESVSQKLGMGSVDGKKSERIAKIAMHKLHQRLGTTI